MRFGIDNFQSEFIVLSHETRQLDSLAASSFFNFSSSYYKNKIKNLLRNFFCL